MLSKWPTPNNLLDVWRVSTEGRGALLVVLDECVRSCDWVDQWGPPSLSPLLVQAPVLPEPLPETRLCFQESNTPPQQPSPWQDLVGTEYGKAEPNVPEQHLRELPHKCTH